LWELGSAELAEPLEPQKDNRREGDAERGQRNPA
jgi:hypothetical protein